MIKTDLRIKEKITFQDKKNAINEILESNFVDGNYTPYYQKHGEIVGIAFNFLEGIEFEDNDNVFDLYDSDVEFKSKVDEVRFDVKYMQTMDFVRENANLLVEFAKEKNIHRNETLDKIGKFFDIANDAFENFSKLDLKKLSQDDTKTVTDIIGQLKDKDITIEMLTDVIKNAVGFDMDKASSEIIDAKNEEIRKLKEENTKLKSLDSARNVLNVVK